MAMGFMKDALFAKDLIQEALLSSGVMKGTLFSGGLAGNPLFPQKRKQRSIIETGRMAIDAAQRFVPEFLQIVKPEIKRFAARPVVQKALTVVNTPDTGPLLSLGSWYAYAAASDPDQLPYDVSFWRACVNVVGNGLGTWLIARRSKAAWSVLGITGGISAVLATIQAKHNDVYVTRTWKKGSVRDIVFNKAMPVLHGTLDILGLFAARTTGEPFVNRIGRHVPAVVSSHWPQVRSLCLYYMVFSLVGHWGEMLFCTAIKHGLVGGDYDRSNHMLWDQWLFPFPAEGSVAVLVALLLHPFQQFVRHHARSLVKAGMLSKFVAAPAALFVTFLLNQLVCTTIDYTTGLVANQNYELWDYRNMPFNFQGQICLQNSLIYSAIATYAVWHLFPLMEKGMALAGDTAMDGAFVGLGSLFLFLELLYHAIPPRSDKGIEGNKAEELEGDEAEGLE